MVRAILEGRKTQTRRLKGLETINGSPDKWEYGGATSNRQELYKWYETLWNKLNSKRGYSWESNPFVFVMEFLQIGNHKGE